MLPNQTIILRHSKENLKKCSLRGLEQDPLFKFYTYPKEIEAIEGPFILLTLNAPPLQESDKNFPLLLIDGTWRYAAIMQNAVLKLHRDAILRSLPAHIETAYPRKQTLCEDEKRGLASIEALYIAHKILGLPYVHLLDNYHWREAFLAKCDKELEKHK